MEGGPSFLMPVARCAVAAAAALALAGAARAGDPGAYVPGADQCLDAVPIAGEGVFPFDALAATTDGLPHAACESFGATLIENDVWFAWIASCDFPTTIATCGLVTGDSFLALYRDDGACPPGDASLIACADDSCGDDAAIDFTPMTGTRYLIRIGNYPGEAPLAGAVRIVCMPPREACAAKSGGMLCDDPLGVGDGVFEFDTALDPVPESGPSSCGIGDTLGRWFCYTAERTGIATASTCGGAAFDTTITVYADCRGNEIACDNDSCGMQSSVSWPIVAGERYLVRAAGNAGAAGTIALSIRSEGGPTCEGDADGDGAIGLGDIAVMILHWTETGRPGIPGDVNLDGVVGLADVAVAILEWTNVCSSECRVATYTVPANRNGCAVRPSSVGRSKVGERFEMIAGFTGACACCEYRQYVKGEFLVDGVKLEHPLPGGKRLERDTYHEDGLVNPPAGINVYYGHRAEGNTDPSDIYSTDRPSGCDYSGRDYPGVASSALIAVTLTTDLGFRGEIIDTCRGGEVKRSSEWIVACSGTVAAGGSPPAISRRIAEMVIGGRRAIVSLAVLPGDALAGVVSIANGDGSAAIDAADVDLNISGLIRTAQPGAGRLPETELKGAAAQAVYRFSYPPGSPAIVGASVTVLGQTRTFFVNLTP